MTRDKFIAEMELASLRLPVVSADVRDVHRKELKYSAVVIFAWMAKLMQGLVIFWLPTCTIFLFGQEDLVL